MTIHSGKWIWFEHENNSENERICFCREFPSWPEESLTLRITAISKYVVYFNGIYLGGGPIRSPKGTAYYDEYDLSGLTRDGENRLWVEVWNYGWSTYQSFGESGGLWFEIESPEDGIVCCSDSSVTCAVDEGFISCAPKRNVNLGFTDYYDSRKFDPDQAAKGEDLPHNAGEYVLHKTLKKRPIRSFLQEKAYPSQVLKIEDVKQSCHVYSVNTRNAFFPGRIDADETMMTGFLGCIVRTDRELTGRISFPNRTWNGMIGSFRIGGTVYDVSDKDRDKEVTIPSGESLFLIRFGGKFDDLYCHIEMRFEEEPQICRQKDGSSFFTIGPLRYLTDSLLGKQPLSKEIEDFTAEEDQIFSCTSMDELLKAAHGAAVPFTWVEPRYAMKDMYLLSLARLAVPVAEYAVQDCHRGILWHNGESSVISPPVSGDCRRMLVDFGDIYVGQAEFTLCAPEGTIIDIYGFENMYRDEIDFTIGLNNGLRYICREGWQHFRGMARIGMRYALISVRFPEIKAAVFIRDFHLNHATFSVSNAGSFCCEDEKLNRIWSMCRHTHELCLEDSFTDCPTYEQAFWLGDAQVSAMVNSFVFGDYSFVRHNLILGASAGFNSPLFNALTPTDWTTCIPMWTFNWMIAIIEYVDCTGDHSILPELYDKVRDVLLYYRELLTEDGGLIVYSWNLIDWAHLDTPEGYTLTAYQVLLAYCYQHFSAFALELDHPEDHTFFRDTETIMRSYLDSLWQDERQAYCDARSPEGTYSSTCSIQTHSLLLLFHGITDPVKEAICRNYINNPPADFIQVGSPFMLYYSYEARAAYLKKKEEEITGLDQILDDIRFRWGEMLRYESTTCWEVFPGFYENSRTRSYCHSWSSSPAAFLQKYLLGIKKEAEGFKKVTLSLPDTSLAWARGSIPTPYGPIYTDWNQKTREYLVKIPEQVEAQFEIPDNYHITVKRTR